MSSKQDMKNLSKDCNKEKEVNSRLVQKKTKFTFILTKIIKDKSVLFFFKLYKIFL